MKTLIEYLKQKIDHHVEANEAYESLSENYQLFVSEDFDKVAFTIERENVEKIELYNTSFDINLLIHGHIQQDKHNDLHVEIDEVQFFIFFEDDLEAHYIKDIKNNKFKMIKIEHKLVFTH